MFQVYSLKEDGEINVHYNFKAKEFACKDGSDLILIDNNLLDVLQAIRNEFNKPVTVTSGFRTGFWNYRMGGAKYSQHLYGRAADIFVRDVSLERIAAFAGNFMKKYGYIELHDTYVHIDTRVNEECSYKFVDKSTIKGK